MLHLRNKVTALFLPVVIAGILGSTIFTTQIFISDKRNYIMELNSITAPNVASAIEKHLDYLQDQISLLDAILERSQSSTGLLRSAFEKLHGVEQIDVYQKKTLLVTLSSSMSRQAYGALQPDFFDSKRGKSERRLVGLVQKQSPSKPSKMILFISSSRSRNDATRDYVAWIKPELFQEHFELARSLSIALMDSEGRTLVSTGSEGLFSEYQGGMQEGVMAREIDLPDGSRAIAAVAPILHTGGAYIVVHASLDQASKMVKKILLDSAPFILAILFFAGVLAFLFSAHLAHPIEELTQATARVASGDWKVQLRSRSRDEIGKLVTAFSKMGQELENREEEIKRANGELVKSERLAVLGKFSAGIAHEVKNPLSSILGYAQLIQRKLGVAADPSVPQYVGYIIDETRRASKIITDLLMFARQKPPVLTSIRVSDVLQHAYEMLSPQAANFGAELKLEIKDGEIQANLDKDQIFQVLLNLITNSFHAMESNPMDRPKQVQLGLEREGGDAVISVSDSG